MPWFGMLLTAGLAGFSRLVAVTLLPNAILAMVIWATVRMNAFSPTSHGRRFADIFVPFASDAGQLLLALVVLVVGAVVLQPFEIGAVRLLEGYWGSSKIGSAADGLGRRIHRSRLSRARRYEDLGDSVTREQLLDPALLKTLALSEQAKRHREWARNKRRAAWARRVLPHYPPSERDVLPTRLGNVLRAAERRAGERYRLPTADTLPRLRPYMSERLSTAYDSAVDTLDAAAMMALSFGLSAAICVAAFYDDPRLYWLPIVFACLCTVSYRGAVTVAVTHGVLMDVAFDLHRFDLIKALHLDLPETVAQEAGLALALREFWSCRTAEQARKSWRKHDIKYWHYLDQGERRPEPVDSGSDDSNDAGKAGYL